MTSSAVDTEDSAPETHSFQAEVSRLLDIVANALYSDKEIFVRELISNASDACDKLRYEALTKPELLSGDGELKITIVPDAKKRTVTFTDNGIGMDRAELIGNLGTIAHSGTAAFVDQLAGDARSATSLIGQFGVGFYSAFMVADRVSVVSRRAGSDAAWRWESDGKGDFTVTEGPVDAPRGTSIVVHLKKDDKEFADPARLRRIVKTYSDHIAVPIMIAGGEGEPEQANEASALWMRPKSEIEDGQYAEFYRSTAHMFDEPWLVLHNRAEGKIEYTSLLFVPSTRPFDLFTPERRNHVRLYVKRVFITDDCEDLLPSWLRFLRGVVDSEDLPLNISREMLQANPVIGRIRAGVVKRILGELKKKAGKAPEEYEKFWDNFGAVLKEGLYEPNDSRDDLLALARFRSTGQDALTGLADYIARMAENQDEIYYITGDSMEQVAALPQLEAFRARGVDVLLLTDPIDEFWIPAVGEYEGKRFRSATRGDIALDTLGKAPAEEPAETDGDAAPVSSLTALLKLTLADAVKDVRESRRLTDSAVCLVADEGDMDMHIERLLRQHQQLDTASRRILEINPKHPLIRRLAAVVGSEGEGASETLADAAWLLLDQARIVEGESPPDPVAFARRLSAVMEKGFVA